MLQFTGSQRVGHNLARIAMYLIIVAYPYCKEIPPVHPKGDQSWVFIGRTDAEAETTILWPPHTKG